MKALFDLNNPFIQFLARVGDMILANVLFLICSIPLFTFGASLAALHKVTQNIAQDELTGVLKTFLRAFRDNFKQATAAWLVMLVFFIGMGCNALLVAAYFTGNTATVCNAVLLFIVALMLAVGAYIFPLMVRYENTLKEHLQNAAILAVVKLPRTILMVLLNAMPFLIAYFSLQTFFSTMVFWLTLGFAFVSYICSTQLLPVFAEMEASGGPNMQILN